MLNIDQEEHNQETSLPPRFSANLSVIVDCLDEAIEKQDWGLVRNVARFLDNCSK